MWLTPLPYNEILGRSALAKFMVASHYAYNSALKMPRPMGFISILLDKKEEIICVDKMYREAITAEAAEATSLEESKKGKKASRDTNKESGKRTSLECDAHVDDLLESSNGKRSNIVAPAVKKVPS